MEYTVNKLARLSGVSARTLRYYDQIGLLDPKRINSSGYRIYGEAEINLLQQILFYRELEMSLDDIKDIVHSKTFDVEIALYNHLAHLNQKRRRLEKLIETVEKSIQENRGEIKMSDQEKFEAFKKERIEKNEEQYGEEIREEYGKKAIDESNKKMMDMSKEQYETFEASTKELNKKLAEATELGDPASELGQEVAQLHQDWIKQTWPERHYNEEAHYNLSLMYVEDERFKVYYEEITLGAAEFLNKALKMYLAIETE